MVDSENYQEDLDWLHVVKETLSWSDSSFVNNHCCIKRLYNSFEFKRTILESGERVLLDALKTIDNPNSRAQGFNCLISMRRVGERPIGQLARARNILGDETERYRAANKAGLHLYDESELEAQIQHAFVHDATKCSLLILFAELGCRVSDLGGLVTDDKLAAEKAEDNCFVIRARDVLVIRRKYKTRKIYGEKRDIIRGARGKMLRRCLASSVGGRLVRLNGGSACPSGQMSSRIAEIVGTNATKLFKSWVNVYRKKGDLDGIRDLAFRRGTSLQTVLSYYA